MNFRLETRRAYWGLREYPDAQKGIDDYIIPRLKQLYNERLLTQNANQHNNTPEAALGLLLQIVLIDLDFDLVN